VNGCWLIVLIGLADRSLLFCYLKISVLKLMGRTVYIYRVTNIWKALKCIRMSLPVCVCVCVCVCVVQGAVLQIGRSLVRFQVVSLEFFIDKKSFRLHYGPGVYSASNGNEYQEYFLGVKAAGA
jgi:hypothetical protein